jgi:hypothetical protein
VDDDEHEYQCSDHQVDPTHAYPVFLLDRGEPQRQAEDYLEDHESQRQVAEEVANFNPASIGGKRRQGASRVAGRDTGAASIARATRMRRIAAQAFFMSSNLPCPVAAVCHDLDTGSFLR